MNETQRATFRDMIEGRMRDIALEDALGLDGQSVVTLDQQSVGRLSRMDALQNQAMSKAQAGRRRVEAARLRAALKRLDQCEYGWCEECGEAIPIKRLHLDLAATRCVSCATG